MRLKKFGRIIVVERQSSRAAPKRICRKISAATINSRLKMRVAVTAIPERLKRALQVRHVNDQRTAIHSKRLLKAQISRLAAKIALL